MNSLAYQNTVRDAFECAIGYRALQSENSKLTVMLKIPADHMATGPWPLKRNSTRIIETILSIVVELFITEYFRDII